METHSCFYRPSVNHVLDNCLTTEYLKVLLPITSNLDGYTTLNNFILICACRLSDNLSENNNLVNNNHSALRKRVGMIKRGWFLTY